MLTKYLIGIVDINTLPRKYASAGPWSGMDEGVCNIRFDCALSPLLFVFGLHLHLHLLRLL